MDDPTIAGLRERISELDRTILDAFNDRLELVGELKRFKASRGLDFLDHERERRMLDDLRAANGGPLSDEGVGTLLHALLDLTKREVD